MDLTWGNSDARQDNARVEYRRAGESRWRFVGHSADGGTAFPVAGLRDGTAYELRVRGRDVNGRYPDGTYHPPSYDGIFGAGGRAASEWAPVQAVTPDAAPAAPSGLRPVVLPGGEVRLYWQNEPDNETGYELQRSLDPTFPADPERTETFPLTDPDQTAFADADPALDPTRPYYYQLRSRNGPLESAWTPYVTAAPAVSASVAAIDPRAAEHTPVANPARFVIRRGGSFLDRAVTIPYTLDLSAPDAATPGEDHDLPATGAVTFAPGEVGKVLTANPKDDREMDQVNSVTVALANGQKAAAEQKGNDVLVIVISGHTQNAGDDENNTNPDPKSGMAILAQALDAAGVGIVKSFSEDPGNHKDQMLEGEGSANFGDCGDSKPAILAELEATRNGARQLRSEGKQPDFKVAFVGFSHGGGLIYDLTEGIAAQEADFHLMGDPNDGVLDADSDFTIAFTGYVDAIKQPGDPEPLPEGWPFVPIEKVVAQPEQRLPKLTWYHLSQYQLKHDPELDKFDFHGDKTDGAPAVNIDIDEEENVSTHWTGPVARHIDQLAVVHENVIEHLRKAIQLRAMFR